MIVAPISSMRVGLKTILADKPGIQVIEEAATLDETWVLPPQLNLVIVAILETLSSTWLHALLDSFPQVAFLFLLNPSAPLQAFTLPANHVLGFISIEAIPEDIEAAISALDSGLSIFDPQLSPSSYTFKGSSNGTYRANERQLIDFEKEEEAFTEALTGRENEILQVLALGLTNKEIARRFAISEHTVKFHISSIYSKLGVNNRTEAVRQGFLLGIITI